MSDKFLKIIANEPDAHVDTAKAVLEYLRDCMQADFIELKQYEKVVFVDCGSNLERINCPCCGEVLGFGWWGEAMEQAAQGEFEELKVTVPCCNTKVSLNELKYDYPCGFGRWEIDVLNPQEKLAVDIVLEIERRFGVEVKGIWARY